MALDTEQQFWQQMVDGAHAEAQARGLRCDRVAWASQLANEKQNAATFAPESPATPLYDVLTTAPCGWTVTLPEEPSPSRPQAAQQRSEEPSAPNPDHRLWIKSPWTLDTPPVVGEVSFWDGMARGAHAEAQAKGLQCDRAAWANQLAVARAATTEPRVKGGKQLRSLAWRGLAQVDKTTTSLKAIVEEKRFWGKMVEGAREVFQSWPEEERRSRMEALKLIRGKEQAAEEARRVEEAAERILAMQEQAAQEEEARAAEEAEPKSAWQRRVAAERAAAGMPEVEVTRLPGEEGFWSRMAAGAAREYERVWEPKGWPAHGRTRTQETLSLEQLTVCDTQLAAYDIPEEGPLSHEIVRKQVLSAAQKGPEKLDEVLRDVLDRPTTSPTRWKRLPSEEGGDWCQAKARSLVQNAVVKHADGMRNYCQVRVSDLLGDAVVVVANDELQAEAEEMARRTEAALRIQGSRRGALAHREVKRRRNQVARRNKAALDIQCGQRGRVARAEMNRRHGVLAERQEVAALQIQGFQRQRAARGRVVHRRQQHAAATKLQALQRGQAGRNRAAIIKEYKKSHGKALQPEVADSGTQYSVPSTPLVAKPAPSIFSSAIASPVGAPLRSIVTAPVGQPGAPPLISPPALRRSPLMARKPTSPKSPARLSPMAGSPSGGAAASPTAVKTGGDEALVLSLEERELLDWALAENQHRLPEELPGDPLCTSPPDEQAAPPPEAARGSIDYEAELKQIYVAHCPAKLSSIEKVLRMHEGAEEDLLNRLRTKYKVPLGPRLYKALLDDADAIPGAEPVRRRPKKRRGRGENGPLTRHEGSESSDSEAEGPTEQPSDYEQRLWEAPLFRNYLDQAGLAKAPTASSTIPPVWLDQVNHAWRTGIGIRTPAKVVGRASGLVVPGVYHTEAELDVKKESQHFVHKMKRFEEMERKVEKANQDRLAALEQQMQADEQAMRDRVAGRLHAEEEEMSEHMAMLMQKKKEVLARDLMMSDHQGRTAGRHAQGISNGNITKSQSPEKQWEVHRQGVADMAANAGERLRQEVQGTEYRDKTIIRRGIKGRGAS